MSRGRRLTLTALLGATIAFSAFAPVAFAAAAPGAVAAPSVAAENDEGSGPAAEAAARVPTVVPAEYEVLLRDHVVTVPERGGALATRFDYAALHAREDQAALRGRIRDAFLAGDPEALDPAARTAWAVNTYNFLVIDVVTEHFLTASGDTLVSVADIGAGEFTVFDEERFMVAGEAYSLNRFEGHYLFLDVDREAGPVPAGLDPRLHFAIVCAARGCPPLSAEPYRPETLAAQLDRAAAETLDLRGHLHVKGPMLHLSRLFEWYAVDFGGTDGILAFVGRHGPVLVSEAVEQGWIENVRTDLEWDWSLNRP